MNKTEELMAKGNSCHAVGDYDNAINCFTQVIHLKPKWAGAYNNRGNAHRHKGDYDHALADYNQAIAIDPRFAKA